MKKNQEIFEFDLNWFKDQFKGANSRQKKEINKIIIKKIGELFDDENLSKFIVKNLEKEALQFDLVYEINNMKRGSTKSFHLIKKLILDQYLDYYLNKVTPSLFNRKAITGNRQLDAILNRHFEKVLNTKLILSFLEKKLNTILSTKVKRGIKNIDIPTESIQESIFSDVKDKLQERKYHKIKIKFTEILLSHVPNANDYIVKTLFRAINNESIDNITNLIRKYHTNKAVVAASIITPIIIDNFLNYLNKNTTEELKQLYDMVKMIYQEPTVEKLLRQEITIMMKNNFK